MGVPPSEKAPLVVKRPAWKAWAAKVVALVVFGLVFGWVYDWASPRFYGPDRVAGFRLGVLHGALMPVAFPTLLMGKDVPIYSPNNSGRVYKLGYLAGVNLCGLLFFGLAFRPPRRVAPDRPDTPR